MSLCVGFAAPAGRLFLAGFRAGSLLLIIQDPGAYVNGNDGKNTAVDKVRYLAAYLWITL